MQPSRRTLNNYACFYSETLTKAPQQVWQTLKNFDYPLFASGDLTPQDMDGIMYEMHKAYFKYREQKREKERIMNL